MNDTKHIAAQSRKITQLQGLLRQRTALLLTLIGPDKHGHTLPDILEHLADLIGGEDMAVTLRERAAGFQDILDRIAADKARSRVVSANGNCRTPFEGST